MKEPEERVSSPAVQDVRDVAHDIHHGLRDRSIVGAADALAHVLERAREAGVPEAECQRMATESFGQLMEVASPRPRRPWRRRTPQPRQLPAPPKQLPPGG